MEKISTKGLKEKYLNKLKKEFKSHLLDLVITHDYLKLFEEDVLSSKKAIQLYEEKRTHLFEGLKLVKKLKDQGTNNLGSLLRKLSYFSLKPRDSLLPDTTTTILQYWLVPILNELIEEIILTVNSESSTFENQEIEDLISRYQGYESLSVWNKIKGVRPLFVRLLDALSQKKYPSGDNPLADLQAFKKNNPGWATNQAISTLNLIARRIIECNGRYQEERNTLRIILESYLETIKEFTRKNDKRGALLNCEKTLRIMKRFDHFYSFPELKREIKHEKKGIKSDIEYNFDFFYLEFLDRLRPISLNLRDSNPPRKATA